jgi:hypothetical protein
LLQLWRERQVLGHPKGKALLHTLTAITFGNVRLSTRGEHRHC